MASNVSFRILIAGEGFERFDVIIRPQELAETAAGQLTVESDMESGFGKSAGPASRICGSRGPNRIRLSAP
jgi:hypothetical protein